MLITEDKAEGEHQIQCYEPGKIIISQQIFSTSLIVSRDKLTPNWPPTDLTELTPADWAPVLDFKPDIVILGTGQTAQFAKPWQLEPLHRQSIGIECMATAAACRTLIALISEERNAVAALIL